MNKMKLIVPLILSAFLMGCGGASMNTIPDTAANRALLIECKKAQSIRNSAAGGSVINILVFAVTGGSKGNERSFDRNNERALTAQAFLSEYCSEIL